MKTWGGAIQYVKGTVLETLGLDESTVMSDTVSKEIELKKKEVFHNGPINL